MYSTRLDKSSTKAKAREEAKKFTKENLEKDLRTLLNYIQVSVNFLLIFSLEESCSELSPPKINKYAKVLNLQFFIK
ncbi:hypothetical protein [Borreliella bissettiae]|uniref:hypothetical protein n=1 Tax=Borrelia bissettiae TaxID=64897 RepID=UPI00264910FE|nr:hypothetical protein [Borreliella bissettiae]WKD00299.1 hypothetical protein QIA02_04465 [Borreliella bissettiae]